MRRLRLLTALTLLVLGFPPIVRAESALIKGSGPAVYFVDEGKRYVFPNEKIYFSWYADFSGVRTVSDPELASYLIGGNVTYKPGSRLVKIQSDPRVFAVAAGGALRWISSEDAAKALYGQAWNRQVDDLSDAFFFDYKEGEAIMTAGDFDKESESAVVSIMDDLAARNGLTVSGDFTAVRSGAWSDPQTWGGAKPSSGARVTIPTGVIVAYDLSEGPSIKSVTVNGTLSFAPDRSTRLAVRQMTVRGSLQAGDALNGFPRDKRAVLALTGAATTAVADDGLTVDGGTLAMYGFPERAWTRLAAPATAGSSKLMLEKSAIAWPIGAEIAVLGMAAEDTEIRKIAAMDGDTITLDAPFEKTHRLEEGLRSEAVLLGRNVVIEGVGGGQGSYVRAINRAKVTLHHVELASLGRKGVPGQHPLFLDGLSSGSLVSNIVRDSGNRGIALRQASETSLLDNVVFRAYGHGIALEDGAERDNLLARNLIADLRASALAPDAVPAGFLLRNPDNRLEDNVVVGSAGFGYWYLLADEAVTNSGARLRPRETPLGSFAGNVARNNAKIGLYVDDGQGKGDYIPDTKAVFTGLTSVLNGERGFWIRGVNLEVRDSLIAENPIGGTLAAFGATFRDSKVWGLLPGSAAPGPAKTGFNFDDGPVSVKNVAFARFGKGSAALGFEEGNPEIPDPRNSYTGLTFTEANVWRAGDVKSAADLLAVVRDTDALDETSYGMDSPFLGKNCKLVEGNVRRCPYHYSPLEIALRDVGSATSINMVELGTGTPLRLYAGTAFDGRYATIPVREGGMYRIDPNVPKIEFAYDQAASGTVQVRVPADAAARVQQFNLNLEQTHFFEMSAGHWTYDEDAHEAWLWLRPGDDFVLSR